MTADGLLPTAAWVVAQMDRVATGAPGSGGATLRPRGTAWAALIVDLVESNLRQWDLEDTTRDPDATDSEIAAAKREIDRLNMGRHRLVQEIDAAIESLLDQPAAAPLATESPGMVLDRLSVLVIRRVRTAGASGHDPTLANRVLALDAQVGALSMALDSYMEELRTGNRRFIRYESLKLYGGAASPAGSAKECRR